MNKNKLMVMTSVGLLFEHKLDVTSVYYTVSKTMFEILASQPTVTSA
eukprot:SAG11_NODE_2934_length_2828_cov_1.446684_1_plen_47_part_00